MAEEVKQKENSDEKTSKEVTEENAEKKPETKVSKKKLETVKKIIQNIKENDTVMLASIKNLPSRQFQSIRKELREKAEIMVVKKRVLIIALEDSGDEPIKKLKEHVCEDSAILFSKEDAFELAGLLADKKSPIKAKAGQETTEDIEVEAGVTDLIPGPAISELGNLGIKIAVEDGKIAIKEKKVIVKVGEVISGEAASIMAKLDIIPFEIGLEPIAIYDKKEGKIYLDVKINKKEALEELKTSKIKALGLAQKIVYYCKETIGYLLAKANADQDALEKLQPAEEKVEEKKEESKEEKVEEKKEEVKEEVKEETEKEEKVEEKKEESKEEKVEEKPTEEKKEETAEEKK